MKNDYDFWAHTRTTQDLTEVEVGIQFQVEMSRIPTCEYILLNLNSQLLVSFRIKSSYLNFVSSAPDAVVESWLACLSVCLRRHQAELPQLAGQAYRNSLGAKLPMPQRCQGRFAISCDLYAWLSPLNATSHSSRQHERGGDDAWCAALTRITKEKSPKLAHDQLHPCLMVWPAK